MGSPSPAPAAGPTNTTVTNTNIPDYAQPYVENMLNAAQAQIYNPSMTGFNQYVPYSQNPADYVAGFSPLQQQAQSSAANLQTPGQYGQATNLAGTSALGALNTTGQAAGYGAMGAQAGAQGAQQSTQAGGLGEYLGGQGANIGASLGQQSQNASTGPGSVASYMNPYLQQSLAPQLQLANQQYGQLGAQEQGQATQAGAFGGSREALMGGLNQQNQMLAQNQIIGQGYNTAFNNAQQQMNAANQAALSGNAQALQGANMGLQAAGQAGNLGIAGAQAGLSGVGAEQAGYGMAGNQAANLANIGTQQLGAQQNILNTQNQLGGQQQANQQNIINQAVQNYATAQQYPYMQLGQLNAMLRGLPMQQSSTSMYQAAPNLASQAGGVGLAGLGTAAMMKAVKRGGVIKKMAVGGALPMNMMTQQQLGQVQQSPVSTPIAKMYAQGLEQTQAYDQANPEASKVFAQPLEGNIQQSAGIPAPQQMANIPAPMQQGMAPQRTGVAGIGTGNMTQMAGGGIIAFADEGQVKDDLDLKSIIRDSLESMKSSKVSDAYAPIAEEQRANIAQQKSMIMPEMLTRFGLGMMASPGGQPGSGLNQFLANAGRSGATALQGMTQSEKDLEAQKRLLQTGTIDAAKADQTQQERLLGAAVPAYVSEKNKEAQIEAAKLMHQATAGDADTKLLLKAQALMGTDPLIKKYQAQQKNLDQNDPQYNVLEQRIAERQNQIYDTVGLKHPEITPSKIPDYVLPPETHWYDGLFGGSSKPVTPTPIPQKVDTNNPLLK